MNVIFTCGGTAGHINPAIAVANLLKERHPDAKFLCINSISNAEPQDVDKVIAWLEKRLGVTTD